MTTGTLSQVGQFCAPEGATLQGGHIEGMLAWELPQWIGDRGRWILKPPNPFLPWEPGRAQDAIHSQTRYPATLIHEWELGLGWPKDHGLNATVKASHCWILCPSLTYIQFHPMVLFMWVRWRTNHSGIVSPGSVSGKSWYKQAPWAARKASALK